MANKGIEKILKSINKTINTNFVKKAEAEEKLIARASSRTDTKPEEPAPFRESIDSVFDKDNEEDTSMSGTSNVGISSPWVRYIHKIQALFGKDPEIHIEWNDERMLLTMRVDNQRKADALCKLIPAIKKFGNVDILINIVPSNKIDKAAIDTIKTAFEGNPIVSKYYEVPDVMTNRMYYMMFAPEVVQYYDDNLADPRGFISTLYENIAAEVIENHDGVYFCTDDYIEKDSGEE